MNLQTVSNLIEKNIEFHFGSIDRHTVEKMQYNLPGYTSFNAIKNVYNPLTLGKSIPLIFSFVIIRWLLPTFIVNQFHVISSGDSIGQSSLLRSDRLIFLAAHIYLSHLGAFSTWPSKKTFLAFIK